MMELTTLIGSTQLMAQAKLRAAATLHEGRMIAPNVLTIALQRTQFAAEWEGEPAQQIERFRLAIAGAMDEFIQANRWRVGGFGRVVINLLLADLDAPCRVKTLTWRKLYSCIIHDDAGQQSVSVRQPEIVVGREHSNPPAEFIPLRDGARQLSRKHLRLRYCDLQLHSQLIGHNPTTINGAEMGTEWTPLNDGDQLICGNCKIQIAELSGSFFPEP
ncbi:MAG: FHA domain-containing protein [Armatimonadetes bacterium]|nr:FHA domain-containing protein [Armatimonadota bacterium]